jgi:predicted DNA binding CopG/RHH family protein
MTRRVHSEDEEVDLLESFERGEWKRSPEIDAWRARLREAAATTARKERRINIRLTERDLRKLQTRAMEEGIPYQTLITSVLHKYVTGRLDDAPATKKRT